MGKIRAIETGAGTEVENTTTEGSLWKRTFAADSLKVGTVHSFRGAVVVADNNSTDTVTLRVRFGTNATLPASNTACGTSSAIDAVDSDFATIDGVIEVQSATRAVCYGRIAAPDAANVEAAYPFHTVLTIAAGTAYYLDLSATWSVAHADNEVASSAAHSIEYAE